MDITDHYELIEVDCQQLFDTLEGAKHAAAEGPDRIWFVREGDEVECSCDPDIDEIECDCSCDAVWDVELFRGQFVNRMGYFVTTQPCRDEHRSAIFTY